MSGSLAITTSTSVTYQGIESAAPAPKSDGLTFGEVLSDLNPLQYLPVIGTIYRAVTGDTIPKPLREAGSVLVSGLLGGPVGVVTNLSILALEKLTGVDLEDVEQGVLAQLGFAKSAEPGAASQNAPVDGPGADPTPLPAKAGADGPSQQTSGVAWTASQLAAYGVTTLAGGDLRGNGLTGADVLNDLQLRQTAETLAVVQGR